ncbi:hypothetical protein [Clostridium gasigenes]|uniref:hypothetical protein n=1 Tax=Clostridium gasigenes TaxID=94869 RepID=UPI001A9ABCD8|nr:hypothetical protein [Clostridium gasigenes]
MKNFEKVRGEISLAFFAYNLKRVINIIGVKELVTALLTSIISSLFFEKELLAA